MYEQTEWPDRIYVEEEYHQKYLELQSKSEDDRYPFKSMKEIFMFSLILGYLQEEDPKPIEKKKELIFEKYLDGKIDKPLIKCLYILNKKNDECIIDKKGAIETAQEYANSGFEVLYDAVTKGHDMIISLTEFLMENYLRDRTE